jgi:hypothetical protein
MTHVDGTPAAMLLVQRASPRYLQRPDATHVKLNPNRTSMTGGRADLTFERLNGRHWLWAAALRVESPELEHNDMGRLGNGDGIQLRDIGITYRETRPGRHLRNYRFTLSTSNDWTFGGTQTYSRVTADLQSTFANFRVASLSGTLNRRGLDWQLTRGGPLMQTPQKWSWTGTLHNRGSASTFWSATGRYDRDELGGVTRHIDGQYSFRPRPNWQLSLTPLYEHEINPRQYVSTLDGGRPETYGQRYIFGFIDRTTLSTQVRLNYTFRPDLTLDLYAEPFAASGRYYDFGELAAARSRVVQLYGTNGTNIAVAPDASRIVQDGPALFTIANRDFNVRSMRSNLVLRWEWRPGSSLFVVWQQDRHGSAPTGAHVGFTDLFGAFSAQGVNVLEVKTTFWLSR